MKNQIDLKSLLIGFLGAGLLIATLSFKDSHPENQGRYQTEVSQTGVVILDTQDGSYIMSTELTNNHWVKGDFYTTHKASKGIKSKD